MDVRIGPNVVVGACSLINKSIPEGIVYAGIPAKQIGTFAQLLEKRATVDKKSCQSIWEEFKRDKK